MKPWSGLAAMMLLLSMALFVASMASSMWLDNSQQGVVRHHGPFEACVDDWKNNVHECRRFDNSCTATFSDPVGTDRLADCLRTRVVRAFLVMGLLFAGMAFVLTWLGYNSYDDLLYRLPALLLSLVSMSCGLIAWAVWTAMGQQKYDANWHYGWGYGLSLGAWLLPLAAAVTCLIPSPARDLKDTEALARGTAHRRPGSWADLLSASWWTGSRDWGARDVAGEPRGAAYGRAPGTTYEERGGTAYRSGEPGGGVGYGSTAREREAERERERAPGTYGFRESEAERLAREGRLERGGVHSGSTGHGVTGASDPRGKSWLERKGDELGLTRDAGTTASSTMPGMESTAHGAHGTHGEHRAVGVV